MEDFVEITAKREKISKNKKKYCLIEAMNYDGMYFPIFSWSAELCDSISVGDEVLAKFSKKNGFININSIIKKY